jgi:hypothetical protein
MAEVADMDGVIGPALSLRLGDELRAALRRKPTEESDLAGAYQVLISHSEVLAEAAAAALDVLTRRGALERPLFVGLLRGLVERGDARATDPLLRALALEDGGGLATITSAALSKAESIAAPLAKLATSRSSHIAFAAELARATRGDSKGERLISLAPRLKESYRIELLSRVVLPLVRYGKKTAGGAAAFAVLRDTERHLGRWLCLAESAVLCGDETVGAEALAQAKQGATGARLGWNLIAWALNPERAVCEARPTLELIARLSDRPSAERELSFLFRMADSGQVVAKAMLESLVKQPGTSAELSIRAMYSLVRNYGRPEFVGKLVDVAKSAKHENVRGLSLACLHDIDPRLLNGIPLVLELSRKLTTAVWSVLVRLSLALGARQRLVTEPMFRRVQLGWPD